MSELSRRNASVSLQTIEGPRRSPPEA
jgi:hypothetical protein